MLYFIPSWYSTNEWKEKEQFWYKRRMQTEMDDTVKQIQLFNRNDICDFQILLLSFAPNFRHFLHRQSVFRAPYWSCFDAIQCVKRKKPAVLSFHNLNWPKNVEFIYSQFAVIAMLNNEKYAQIEFGEDGNPIQVDIFENGQLKRKNIYDDRGFVSCTSIYENGEKAYDQYLSENGTWKICHFADGHVAINPKSNWFLIKNDKVEMKIPFSKQYYDSIEEVIEEVLRAFLSYTTADDIFCAALHEQHMNMLDKILFDRRTIFSAFGDRIIAEDNEKLKRLSAHANYIVADSPNNLRAIKKATGIESSRIVNIQPYDTRIDIGISQQLHVQKILLPVDSLSKETFEEAIKCIAGYLLTNQKAQVHLFTRNSKYDCEKILLDIAGQVLKTNGYPPEWAKKENQTKFDILLDEEEQIPVRFVVEQCIDELSVNKCVREQRILIDLGDNPDLFLQIACVSMGIPQILKRETQYMHNGKNGIVNEDLHRLGEDVGFYLENITNWNHAAIYSYKLSEKNTTKELVKQWKEVIENIEECTCITAGN